MPTKKKRRPGAHAASLKKYTAEERREREKAHAPVEREHFEEVMRRLVTAPPEKKR
jgi:hypothetical protein